MDIITKIDKLLKEEDDWEYFRIGTKIKTKEDTTIRRSGGRPTVVIPAGTSGVIVDRVYDDVSMIDGWWVKLNTKLINIPISYHEYDLEKYKEK